MVGLILEFVKKYIMIKILKHRLQKFSNDIFAQIGLGILIIIIILSLIQSFLPSPFDQNLQFRLLEIGSEILDSKIIKNQRKTKGISSLIMYTMDLFL